MIDIKHLKTLAAVRDRGSLAAAAKSLNVTQSALSHQIKNLEQLMDMEFLVRQGRKLQFTRAGERLLQLADDVLPRIRSAQLDLKQIKSGRSGRLHIAVECHSCFEWLIPTMNNYRNDWPEVEMDISMAFNFDPLTHLHNGDLDLVITSDPQDLPDIHYTPLFRFQVLLVTSPGHPLASKPFITPQDLADQTVITYPVDRKRLDLYQRFLLPAHVEPAHQRTAESTLVILQLVASRRGVAALPHWVLNESFARNNLSSTPLTETGLWSELFAATREADATSDYLHEFIAIARERSEVL